MKDTKQRVHPSDKTVEASLLEEDLKQALVLGTGDLLRTAMTEYTAHVSEKLGRIQITEENETLLEDLISKQNNGFANRDSFKRILLSPLAQDIMFIIWRESEFLKDDALSIAGLGRQFYDDSNKPLTRNSLKNTVIDEQSCFSARGGDALKRTIDRICVALEVYGLVERTTVRPNLKPIRGTRRLHTLMSSAHMAVAHVFAKQLHTDDGAHDE